MRATSPALVESFNRSELRIVEQALWDRAQARHAEMRALVPTRGLTLMRGRNAAMFSKNLMSGFMRCGTCGLAVTVVHHGSGSPRYGCTNSWRNGASTCANRLTIRAKIVDAHLLEAMRRELLEPATIKGTWRTRSPRSCEPLIDNRPARQEAAQRARDDVGQRLQWLVASIEKGVPPESVAAPIVERQAELARLDAELASFTEPLHQRLAVHSPRGWSSNYQDVASLLSEAPARTKSEFRRLGLRVTMEPVYDASRAFYRAHAIAALPILSGTHDLLSPTTVRSRGRAAPARNSWRARSIG